MNGLEHMSYEEWLNELGVSSVEKRSSGETLSAPTTT